MIPHQNVTNVTMKTYHIRQPLGSGTSSIVYHAYNPPTRTHHAVKVIPKAYLNSCPKLFELVKTQISILKSCDNLNVIKCYDVFQSEASVFIVTELCAGCDMEVMLGEEKWLAEDHAVMYLKQILNGFKGLHQLGAMHRDFKLANLLLDGNGVCKIADLGYAKKMKKNDVTFTLLGTQITMAPEVLEGNGYGYQADIWSLGVVFYQLLFGVYPFMGVNSKQLLRKIKLRKIDYQSRRISDQAKDFIQKCLTLNPRTRITWPQIYSHPILNKQTFQILYSISNPLQRLQQNYSFYHQIKQIKQKQKQKQKQKSNLKAEIHRQKQSQVDQFGIQAEQSIILRQSSRKKIVIEQIQQIISQKIQTLGSNIEQQSANSKFQLDRLLYKYAFQYIIYFNKLIYPFKFLRIQLIEDNLENIMNFINVKPSFTGNLKDSNSSSSRNQSRKQKIKVVGSDIRNRKYQSRQTVFQRLYLNNGRRNNITDKKIQQKNPDHPYKSSIQPKQNKIPPQHPKNPPPPPLQPQSLLFLTLKKSYIQSLQYQKILKNKINIFKIPKNFQLFTQSHNYLQIQKTIEFELAKAEIILKEIEECACLSEIEEISLEACQQGLGYERVVGLWERYVGNGRGWMGIYQYFKVREQEDQNFGDWMEGLLYYLISDQKSKITPQQFDKKIGQPVNWKFRKSDLIYRYQIYLKYV